MLKFCSLSCVIGWCAFWAFGFLALTGAATATNTYISMFLAAAGMVVGTFSYLRLSAVAHAKIKKG